MQQSLLQPQCLTRWWSRSHPSPSAQVSHCSGVPSTSHCRSATAMETLSSQDITFLGLRRTRERMFPLQYLFLSDDEQVQVVRSEERRGGKERRGGRTQK